MLLSELFDGAPDLQINQLSTDSRMPMKNCIFFCVKGIKDDGHGYIEEAVENGASVIVYENDIPTDLKVVYIRVNNVKEVLNEVAAKFYHYPAKQLETYLCAGCYGRSSVSYLIHSLLSNFKKAAYIGIYGIYYDDNRLLSRIPSLTILENQKYMDQFVKQGIEACTFEANSISLSYGKLDGISANAFVFSSTGTESMDYRETGREYFDTFRKYIYSLDDSTIFVLNRDDPSYFELAGACGNRMVSYGSSLNCDYFISDIQAERNHSSFIIKHDGKSYHIQTKLLGEQNIYNVTAALATLNELNYDMEKMIEYLQNISAPEGVMENLDIGQNFKVIIDCASTNESIQKVLQYSKSICSFKKRLVALVSVNSNDDKRHLSELSEILQKYCNLVIFTEDYSLNGDINDNLNIASSYINKINYLTIENREEAIHQAIQLLNNNDVLLILGKGNENYLYQGLDRVFYKGDKDIAIKYIKERMEEENETIEIY